MRHCLQNALVLTIYAHFQQKLAECAGKHDLTIMLGEQLAAWIVQINIEALYPIGELGGKEGKMVLLLSLYADLLAQELNYIKLPQHHSRLRGFLPSISDCLMRWSEDRGKMGLWATIGLGIYSISLILGPKSRLSPCFRLFCKILGTFICIRLLNTDAEDIGWDKIDSESDEIQGMISRIRGMGRGDLESDVESCISFLLSAANSLEDCGGLICKLERMLPELRMY
jgi:hypothetical protein